MNEILINQKKGRDDRATQGPSLPASSGLWLDRYEGIRISEGGTRA